MHIVAACGFVFNLKLTYINFQKLVWRFSLLPFFNLCSIQLQHSQEGHQPAIQRLGGATENRKVNFMKIQKESKFSSNTKNQAYSNS